MDSSRRFDETPIEAAGAGLAPVETAALAAAMPTGPEAGSAGHQALVMQTRFLQEVLAEVLVAFSQGEASTDRLSRALGRYWDASYARRHTRLEIMQLAAGTTVEQNLEQLGRPFIYMIVSELWPKYGASAPSLAADLYWEARSLSLDEAFAGRPELARRNELLARL